uniref:Ankyrin repeat domain-containing protein n=1 Tax=Coturnix japonica TaxID=93934 RepID=A0A8C2SLC4_COTJA
MFPCEVPALHRAVSSGRFRLVRLLLEGGASVNDPDPRGRTALMAACGATYGDPSDRTRMVRYLLSRGADPNAADRAGMTALMVACNERAGPGVAALLLEHGADPGTTDRFGSSALFYAARGGDRDTLQELLDASEARGRQVIIITTATSPSGTKTTRQYRHTAPPEPAPEPEPAAPGPCLLRPPLDGMRFGVRAGTPIAPPLTALWSRLIPVLFHTVIVLPHSSPRSFLYGARNGAQSRRDTMTRPHRAP